MKSNWKNIALILLTISGGVGVCIAAFSNYEEVQAPADATMSESAMMSSQSPSTSCERCLSGDSSHCVAGNCPQSQPMMNMATDKKTAMGVDTAAIMGEAKVTAREMSKAKAPSMADKSMRPEMGSAMMGEAKMAESKMPRSMAPSMADESTKPSLGGAMMGGDARKPVSP